MIKWVGILVMIACYCSLSAQTNRSILVGEVTYITTRNVYVKFASTIDIEKGDTLFLQTGQHRVPALLVEQKSSSSTVCKPLEGIPLEIGKQLLFIPSKKESLEQQAKPATAPTAIISDGPFLGNDPVIKPEEDIDPVQEVLFKERIKGRISAASYSNMSDFRNSHRMRYALSFRGYHLNNSPISVESYVTFRHQLNDTINFGEAFKVYSLALRYAFDKSSHLTVGRKINPKFSSMGAMDGLQLEKGLGNWSFGIIGGSRPDLQTYGLNLNLLQYGAYVSFANSQTGQSSQTTLGVLEQKNSGRTDRRFAYFQHNSTLTKGLSLFSSFEIDLFENLNEQAQSTARLTNIYAALRYRLNSKLRFSFAYDNRRNVIYYESYRNFIDQLIADETRQGFRLNVHYRPFKTISVGLNSGLRFQKSGANPSRNVNGHITFSKLPYLKTRLSLRANFLQTDIIDSQIFGARLSRGFAKNKVRGELYYRWVDYKYKIGERTLHQDIIGASVNFNVHKKVSLHLFYEGVIDNQKQLYHRFNTRIIKRF